MVTENRLGAGVGLELAIRAQGSFIGEENLPYLDYEGGNMTMFIKTCRHIH